MVTSRDPEYVTPEIKAKLRRKNRLMRAGRVEEAAALAVWNAVLLFNPEFAICVI